MSIEIVQSEYGFANLKFSSKPSKELLYELKSNGWGWSSNNGVWYPRSQAARDNNQMFAYRFVAKYDQETARKYSEQQVNDYAAEIKQYVQSDLPEPTEQIETLKEFTERIVQPIVEEYQKQDELKYQEQINSLNENSKKVYELLKATGNLTVEEMLVMVSKIDNAYATNNFEIETPVENNDVQIDKSENSIGIDAAVEIVNRYISWNEVNGRFTEWASLHRGDEDFIDYDLERYPVDGNLSNGYYLTVNGKDVTWNDHDPRKRIFKNETDLNLYLYNEFKSIFDDRENKRKNQEITVTNRLDEIKSTILKSDCKMVVSQNKGLKKVELFNSEKQCIFSREQTESIVIPYQTMEAAWDKFHNAEIQIAREYFDIIESVSSEQLGAIPSQYLNVVVEPKHLHSNELSWEELQNIIILDSDGITQLQNMERFQNLKDTRIQENPLETTKESKTMVAFEYLYDVVDWDVLVETERELNSDDDYHSKMMELRASILDKVCEKLVVGNYENLQDFTTDFNILRDEAIANIIEEYVNNPVVQDENNLTLSYDRVTKRYNEQYADFYKTFAQLQEMQFENESRYVGNARIRGQYNQAFEELVKLSKQELVDIISEGIDFEDSKRSAIRYINSVSPDVQRRMMCTTFGFKNYQDIDNRPTLGSMENGKYIAPTSEEINTYIKDEYDCNRYNGISIAELYQIKREVRDEGLPVKKMQTFINQYEEAKNTGDKKTIKKIEYYLEDINYHSEVDALRNGEYEELRKQYATIDFCVIPVVGEFDVANPAHYDSYQEAVDTMLALNEAHRDEIDYGISLHYNDGDYENGDAIPVYVPGKGIDTTIFKVDSHFRTNVAKKETNDFLHYLNEQLSTNYEIDFDEVEKNIERGRLASHAPTQLKYPFDSWLYEYTAKDGGNVHFLYYVKEGVLKSNVLNDNDYNSVKDFLAEVLEKDLLHPKAKDLKTEREQFETINNSHLNTLKEAIQENKVDEYFDKLIDIVDERIKQIEITEAEQEVKSLETDHPTDEPIQEKEIVLTQSDIDNAEKVIPDEQFTYVLNGANGEEADFFKKKILDASKKITELQKNRKELVNKDGSHPCNLHYFMGSSDWFISEVDNEGIGYGYCILNGDLQNAEWGYVNVCGSSEYDSPLTKLKVNVPMVINGMSMGSIPLSPELDLYLDEGTTIERELYKHYPDYFEEYKNFAKNTEKELAKDTEVSINNIEETNQSLEENNGSKIDIEDGRYIGNSDGSNLNQGVEGQGQNSDRGSNSGSRQSVQLGESQDTISLENSRGISSTDKTGNAAQIDNVLSSEGLSKSIIENDSSNSNSNGSSDLQQRGMEAGQIPSGSSSEQPGHGLQLSELNENEVENLPNFHDDMYKTNSWDKDFPPVYYHSLYYGDSVNGKEYKDNIQTALLVGKAKRGDIDAAIDLINESINEDVIIELKQKYPNAIVCAVNGLEATGHNMIPIQYSHYLEVNGFNVSKDIIQDAKAHHTGADSLDKLLNRVRFSGNIEKGKDYILLDDHISMGSTLRDLRDLRDFIETNGGHVVAITTLTADHEDYRIQVSEENLNKLNAYGQELENLLKEYGITDNKTGLTEKEADKLLELLSDRGRKTDDKNEYRKSFLLRLREIQENYISKELKSKPLTKSVIKDIREKCKEILTKSDNEITESEKEILAQYEGAGGLHEGGQSASAVLSEFYTPNNLIEKVWSIVDNYAPNAVTVLEPTAGTGRFANNRPNNQFTLHELDETSSRIAKILHPEATVHFGAYQKQFFDAGGRIHIGQQKNHYDVVIGNPPYGDYKDEWKGRGEGTEFQTYQEYFLSKGLEALKDKNSILAMVVPSGVLNSQNDKAKKLIAEKGQLIDAYRLPIKTFPTTEVGTDILIFRTWDSEIEKLKEQYKNMPEGQQSNIQSIIESRKQSMAEEISDNFFFVHHPEKVLGEIVQKTNQFGKLENVCVCHDGLTVQDELNKIDVFLTENNNVKKNTYTNEILDKIRAAGIEVITDKDEYFKTLNRIIETNVILEMLEDKPLKIEKGRSQLNADSIPKPNYIIDIRNNQENYINQIELLKHKIENNEYDGKEFLEVMQSELFSITDSKISGYYINEIDNNFYKFRLSDHKAIISDRQSEKTLEESVVIQFCDNKGRVGSKGRLIEFYYSPENITKEKQLSILNGIQDWIKTGEFSGIGYDSYFISSAEEIKRNISSQMMVLSNSVEWNGIDYTMRSWIEKNGHYFERSDELAPKYRLAIDTSFYDLEKEYGDYIPENAFLSFDSEYELNNYLKENYQFNIVDNNIYGFVHNGKIYLNPELINSNSVVHEYTHLWDVYVQKTNPELWNKGLNIFKDTKYWNEVISDPNYQDIKDDENLVLSEIHSRISGDIAEKVLNRIAELDGEQVKLDAIDWNEETWNYIKTLGLHMDVNKPNEDLTFSSLHDFLSTPMKDLLSGKNISVSLDQPSVEPTQTEEKEIEVEENLDDPSKRLYEDTEGLFKKQHKLSTEEFAKFYTGSNFTPEDYNIWGATDWQGNVDLSKLTQTEKEYLVSSDKYVETSEGVYTNAMLYVTGNIYEKLDTLEENKDTLTTINYERAKAILTNAIPKIVPIENIKMDALSPLAEEFTVTREVTSSRYYMGRTELNTSTERINLREDFINWATNRCSPENFNEYNSPINSRRSINNYSIAKISREDIPEDISWQDVVNYIDRVSVPTHIDEKKDTKEEKNRKNLIAGNKKDLRKNTCYELFNRYLQEGLPQEDKERLQHEWNKIYNASVQPDYKKLPLFIEGMNTWKNGKPFMLYKQQVEGVSRLLSKGNGLLAYEVGVGKTAAGIVTTVGQLQTGRCKRPLIIVPNQVYKKWVNDFKELFPDIKINELYNLSDKYIKHCFDEKTHSLAIEPNTVTVITDSALQKITFSDEVCNNELAEDFGYLLGLSEDLNSGDDKTIAEAQQRIQKEIGQASRIQVKKLPEGREQKIQQSYIFIDECGFDNVVIDEAHRYKNLFTVPKPKRGHKEAREFEGLGSGKPSVRAEKVFGLTTLIQRRNEDRNVFLLTATPFTNNPLEVYSMLSYMGRKELLNRHIYDVRDFCTEFAQTKFEYSVKPSGEIEPKQVMKSFKGQKKLKNLVFDYIDQVSAKEAGINRPEGERHKVMLELSPLQDRIIKLEQETIAKSDNPYVVLKAMTTMRTATLSPALLDQDDFAGVEDIVIPPTSEIVESSPKLTWVCNTCADLYKQKPECGQFIYMPQGKDYFDEVKNYLIKQGIPEEAIDYIHSTHNGSAEDKDKISARFNDENDKLKILIGTATVAEGIDLNGNSIVEYNTMLGWNPTESIQVEGRIWRQGNKQGKVHIMYPLMENSIDSLIYQKHDEKTSRINSVLSKTDDGKDVIDIEEINPEELKFELITDPTKKVKMIINEKTAEKRKEIKVVENRIETIQELEEDRQNAKNLYDTNVAEKEKYKTLLKTAREELKFNPDNWQYQMRVETNERNVDTCNKEIAKSKNRLNTISYNFNKFDIHDPEREVPIRVQELIVRKAELEAEITKIEQSASQLVVEEQKKILQKKILAKPVEQQRKEMVETVIRDTWYKEQTDDRNQKPPKPIEAVKNFVIPQEILNIFDKAIEEKNYHILGDYLNWGNRDLIPGVAENDKAVEILRNRYETKTGEKLPEKYTQTLDYLASVCNPNTVPEVMKFKSYEDVIKHCAKKFEGAAYNIDGKIEYVTIDNYIKNRDIASLALDLKKKDGESYAGFGSCEYGYQSNAKGVEFDARVDGKREKFFATWNQIAKIKAAELDKQYPREVPQMQVETPTNYVKSENVVQQDLFAMEELIQPVKTINIKNEPRDGSYLLNKQAMKNYRGLPPFIKINDDEYIVRCKGSDFIGNTYYRIDIVDITMNKLQLQKTVNTHLFYESQELQAKKFDNPEFKGKVNVPKPLLNKNQIDLFKEHNISEDKMKEMLNNSFKDLLCSGDRPILKHKEKTQEVKKDIKIINDTDWDYEY